jgi:alanine dehydrogenase
MWMPGDAPLVTRSMLSLMRRGSLIMDVSADPRGGIETSEETSHENPIRVVDGILHYCVQNIPSLFGRTASQALAEVTWPHLERIVCRGPDAAVRDSALLRRGVVLWRGKVVGRRLGHIQGVPAIEPDELLAEPPDCE